LAGRGAALTVGRVRRKENLMTVELDTYGAMLLQGCRLPDTAVGQLADTFGDAIAANAYLTGDQRVALLGSRRWPARAAQDLLCHRFTPDQVRTIVGIEKRRGPLLTLARSVDHDGQVAMLSQRNRAASELAAGFLTTERQVDAAALVDFLDVIGPLSALRALPYASPDVLDDARVAEVIAGVSYDDIDSNVHWTAEFSVGAVIAHRPGVVDELRRIGFAEIATPAIAGSPWVCPDDVDVLLALPTRSGFTAAKVDRCLAANPWLGRNGKAPRLSCGPAELDDDGVFVALEFLRESRDGGATMATHLAPRFALNPALSLRTAKRVARKVRDMSTSQWNVPTWVLDPARAAFAERFAGIELTHPAPEPRAWPSERPLGPTERPADVAERLKELTVSDLHGKRPETIFARGVFAAMLGDDPDAWETAIMLAATDAGCDMAAADLADIASATAGPLAA
jgi:hypothetical protein